MAVTSAGKTITLTAEDDEYPLPSVIKSISWIGATTAGHLLAIGESAALGTPAKTIYSDRANAANYVSRQLIETYYPFGFRLTDLDSGVVQVVIQ